MARSKARKARLEPGHGWRAQPNHKILVLGRGAVRLEIPETWVVEMSDDCVKVFDKSPPMMTAPWLSPITIGLRWGQSYLLALSFAARSKATNDLSSRSIR
jgi:hypothetical protein